MERVRGLEPLRLDPFPAQPRFERTDGIRASRHDTHRGRIDRRDRQVWAQHRPESNFRDGRRAHDAVRHLLHQPPTQRDEAQRVSERHDASQAGSHPFTDAVSDQRVRLDAPRHEQPRQRILDDEQRRLRVPGPREPFGVCRCDAVAGIEQVANVGAEMRREQPGAFVHGVAEYGLNGVQVPRHVDVLRALPGKHEDDRLVLPVVQLAEDGTRIAGFQKRPRLVDRSAHQRAPVAERAPAHLQRVGRVREIRRRPPREEVGEVGGGAFETAGRFGRQQEQLVFAGGVGRLRLGRLLHDQVRVGAAKPEAADAGATPGTVRHLPVPQLRVDVERGALQAQVRIRTLEHRRGRQLAMLHHQRRLDEPGDAGRRVEMPDVRFDGADRAELIARSSAPEGLVQRLDLD